MRDNSGQGKASTNSRDPTLRDNEGRSGTDRPGDRTDGAAFDLGHKPAKSPSDRRRGELSDQDATPPVDTDR
ncbi:hypothetical protein LZK98_19035 [Sphingomonas cannabina]|uniref:hypothetical protein n=1 Tax=Sphingomonas cannabina TaxID=2899123 RepID=UPI001F381FC7|nr:hypothetical protein [Sphingomonas cannabina]UIJ45113.1 hypothetical protein LZK98_19035 [Sphingomonas cannabina]